MLPLTVLKSIVPSPAPNVHVMDWGEWLLNNSLDAVEDVYLRVALIVRN